MTLDPDLPGRIRPRGGEDPQEAREERRPVALPRGRVIAVVGPDGVGKTTLCERIVKDLLGDRRVLHVRFPGLLPRRDPDERRRIRLGEGVEAPAASTSSGDGIEAQAFPLRKYPPAYPPAVSAAKTLYLFVDFVLGWIFRVRPHLRAGGWVVFERGWWDHVVDPRRYRLTSGHLARLLGRLLPPWDLIFVLEAPPEVIRKRKPELPLKELSRQMRAWRELLPPRQRCVYLDAAGPLEDLSRAAGEELSALEAVNSVPSRATFDSAGLPRRSDPRWLVPRGPRAVTRQALAIYHPVTRRGLVGWEAARLAAGLGAFRLLRPAEDLPVQDLLAPHAPAGSYLAVSKANHTERYSALILDASARPWAIAKVATDGRGRDALEREARALSSISPLPSPLRAPRLIGHYPSVLLLEPAAWHPRLRPWSLPVEVASALGRFHRSGLGGSGSPAHGDCAPWNLLRTDDGWVLIDWEEYIAEAPPFYDAFHYLVQAHALLGRPSRSALQAGLSGRGPVGRVLRAYAEGASITTDGCREQFSTYLEMSVDALDPERADGRAGLKARARLLEGLDDA